MNSIRTLTMAAICALAFRSMNAQSSLAETQTEAKPVNTFAYDVVSIRQSKGEPNSAGYGDSPDGFAMHNLTLKSVVPDAYGVARNDLVSGWPKWAATERFNIDAKMDAETAEALHKLPKQEQQAQRQLMLRSLLESRFNLKVHHATTVQTTYELVLAKNGPRLKEDNPDHDLDGKKLQEGVRAATDWLISEGKITGHAMPIAILASHLEGAVDAIVVDKTGLTSRYDIALQWDPSDKPSPGSSSPPGSIDATDPPIFTAIEQQLGLRLKPVKTTVDTIVIDRLEMPSPN